MGSGESPTSHHTLFQLIHIFQSRVMMYAWAQSHTADGTSVSFDMQGCRLRRVTRSICNIQQREAHDCSLASSFHRNCSSAPPGSHLRVPQRSAVALSPISMSARLKFAAHTDRQPADECRANEDAFYHCLHVRGHLDRQVRSSVYDPP